MSKINSPTRIRRAVKQQTVLAAAVSAVIGGSAYGALTNRYSFNDGTANDSVGAAHGNFVIQNFNLNPRIEEGQVFFGNPGGNADILNNNYVDLPNGLGATSSFTIEGWTTWGGPVGNPWQRIFDFGTNSAGEQAPGVDPNPGVNYNGTDYYFLSPRSGGNTYLGEVRRAAALPSNVVQTAGGVNFGTNVEHHFAMVRDGTTSTLRIFVDGVQVAQTTSATVDPALINMQNVWLGRSNWEGDSFYNGSINEFRIYNNAVSNADLALNAAIGPDSLTPTAINTWTAAGAGNFAAGGNWDLTHAPTGTEQSVLNNGAVVTVNSNVGQHSIMQLNNGTVEFLPGGDMTTVINMAPGGTGTATLNLNGGTLTAGKILADFGGTAGVGAKAVNFNGGHLVLTTSHAFSGSNLTSSVGAAGGTITVNLGAVATWGTTMTPSAAGATLTKLGSGTLNLTNSGFASNLAVRAGTLTLNGNVGTTGASIIIGDGNVPGGETAILAVNGPANVVGAITVGDVNVPGNYQFNVNNNSTVNVTGPVTLNQNLTINSATTTPGNLLNFAGSFTSGNAGHKILTFDNDGLVNVMGSINDGAGGTVEVVQNDTGVTFLNVANTYSGNTTVNNGGLVFIVPGAIGGAGQSLTVNQGGVAVAGPGFGAGANHVNLNGTFFNRINPGSAGSLAMSLNSSENIDFSTLGFNSAFLGAGTNVTYTGTFTPASGVYRLGGGSGLLTLPNANAVTGANQLIVGGAGGGIVHLANSNDFSGSIIIQDNNLLRFNGTNALGIGNDSIQIGAGGISLAGENIDLTRALFLSGGAASIEVPHTNSATVSGGITTVVGGNNAATLNKTGPGNLNLLGSVTLENNSLWVRNGTLTLDTGSVIASRFFNSVALNGTDRATMIIKGSALYTVDHDFNVGDDGRGAGSTVEGFLQIQDSAIVNTRTFFVGKFGSAVGNVRQLGGQHLGISGGGEWRIGGTDAGAATAVGTYDLFGGEINTPTTFQVGAFGKGVMTVRNANLTAQGFLATGRFPGGYGHLHVDTGANVTHNVANTFPIIGEQGYGVLTVENGGQFNVTSTSLRVGLAAGGTGVVNLLPGGVITAPGVVNGGGRGQFNFHGGTLRASAAGPLIGGITEAVAWNGGAVLDSNGFDVTVAQGFVAPSGSGLTNIPLTNGGTGYKTHPLVEISGGGGVGATAVPVIDANGTITSIRIVNPGTGYTSTPTVNLRGGAASAPATLGAPALAANGAGGGLTKVGVGTMTLQGISTYNGPTVIEGGTLKLPTAASQIGRTHRYSFNDGTADDSIGGAHGLLVRGASIAGGQVVLDNATNGANVQFGQYVDLPNDIAKTSNLTLETWTTWSGGANWQRIVDFGTNTAGEQVPEDTLTNTYDGSQYIFVTPSAGSGNLYAENFNGSGNIAQQTGPLPTGTEKHVVVTRDAANNTLTLYLDGVQVAQTSAGSDPATYSMVNMWLGRSNWGADAFYNGSINEVRVYDVALTPADIAASFAAGTEALGPVTITTPSYLPVNTAMQLPVDGATFDMANNFVTIGSLAGTTGARVLLGSGTLTVGGNNTSTTYSGEISGTGGLIKQGTGTFTLQGTNTTYTGATTVNGGTLRSEGSIETSSGVAVNTGGNFEAAASQKVQSLSLNTGGKATVAPGAQKALTTEALNLNGGTLDVTNNGAIVDYAVGNSPKVAIRAALASGFNNGAWNGPGIISSTAATTPQRAVGYVDTATTPIAGNIFLGSPVDGTSIAMRFTVLGDTDLDGAVTFVDLLKVSANFGVNNGNQFWEDGDLNYDGSVTFVDLLGVAANFGGFLPAFLPGASSDFNDALAAIAAGQVPEPGSVALLALGASALMMKRRRK